MTTKFIIPGKPQGKERPRFTKSGAAYTPVKTVDYEKAVKILYASTHAKKIEVGTPIRVEITAVYDIAKRENKTRENLMMCGGLRPIKKPDIDNVVKIILDALNKTAWHDDAQVVELTAMKLYGSEPCVMVTIETLPTAIDVYRGEKRG